MCSFTLPVDYYLMTIRSLMPSLTFIVPHLPSAHGVQIDRLQET
jgi:hypothetical protein